MSAGQRKFVDVWLEGFSSAGNGGLLNNLNKMLYANSISKNGIVLSDDMDNITTHMGTF